MKNILLLALSVFPKNPETKDYTLEEENKFCYKDRQNKVYEVSGYYQLEPIPNLLISQGIALDSVIILATQKTMKPADVIMAENVHTISPLEYFSKWISRRFKENLGQEPHCEPIVIDEETPVDAIRQTIEFLQKQNEEDEVTLYVDNHGGFRSTQQIVESIINLLKNEKLSLHAYNVRYESGNEMNVIERDKAIDMFDFVSGINEFTNYGRIDSLLRYIDFEENKSLLEPICEISDGILLCDVSTLQRGLINLKTYYNNVNHSISDPYLKLFENQIHQDYGALLEHDNIHDAAVMVAWCMKKGFYQQALTLIEALMSKTLFEKRHVFTLTDAGQQFMDEYCRKEGINGIFNGCIYVFSGQLSWWQANHTTYENYRKFNDIFGAKRSFTDYTNRMRQLLEGHCTSRTIKGLAETAYTCAIEYGPACSNAITSNIPDQEYNYLLLDIMLLLHKTIKKLRNISNHASESTLFKKEAVINALIYYLDVVDRLSANV